ncbi:GtrA family protein [Eggerthellaceae bacterium 24-137]
MEHLSRTTRQVVSYLAIGAGTALLELAAFQTLWCLTPLGAAPSNVIAVALATIFNFCLNGSVTFQKASNLPRSIVMYVALLIFNTAFSSIAITWLITCQVPALLAKLATMICIVSWNFLLYRKVVFV